MVMGLCGLALTKVIILLLFLATVRGLIRGNLLIEEPSHGAPP
jgi:hypothetical protein